MAMFENYPQYKDEIKTALRQASPAKKHLLRTTAFCAGITVIAAIGAFVASDAIIYDQHATLVRSTVAEALANEEQPIEVAVMEDDAAVAILGQSGANTDKEAVKEHIRTNIDQAVIDEAPVKVVDETTSEVTLQTSDGFDVKVTVKTDDTGNVSVAKIQASVSAAKAPKKHDDALDAAQLEQEKEHYAFALTTFDEAGLLSAMGYSGTPDDEEAKKALLGEHLVVLDKFAVMALPSSYHEEKNADDASPEPAGADPKAEGAHLREQTRTWSSDTGSIITVRTEKLDSSLVSLDGKQVADKMIEYWKETSSAVAQSSGQTISEDGYKTKLFYDAATGYWGYQGSVEFFDENRAITYKRIVLVDDADDDMISIAYRHDHPNSADKGDETMTSEALWRLVGLVPQMPDYMASIAQEKLFHAYEASVPDERQTGKDTAGIGGTADENAPDEETNDTISKDS